MKISLNSQFLSGPFGGGMQFANFIKDDLEKHGHQVVNNLRDPDIDLILHINPFPFLTQGSAYSFFDAYLYKLNHPQTIIVQRINECDERKGTKYLNQLLVQSTQYADHVVFIASWLKPLLQKHSFNKPSSVILNGADTEIFNRRNYKPWKSGPIKIVTHHWGASHLKGHDIYQQLDQLLGEPKFKEKFSFTFIGNYPPDLHYKNIQILKPISGKQLAKELQKHHLYLTASLNEPAGMHHIEGALCGLPLLYRNSGALPEYCKGFGIQFDTQNFKSKLMQMSRDYPKWQQKMKNYPHTALRMGHEYRLLFEQLYQDKGTYQLSEQANIPLLRLHTKLQRLYMPIFYKLKAHV